jgi:hypothetical protein
MATGEDWTYIDLLSEAERREAGLKMVDAALEALGTLPTPDEQTQAEMATRVISAMAAAEEKSRAEEKRLSAEKGGDVYMNIDPAEAVATAYWLWCEGLEIWDGLEPSCIAGGRYIAFAAAMSAVKSTSEALAVLNTDSGLFDYIGKAAVHLARTLPKKDAI